MRYFLWKLFRGNFWIKFTTHYSHPKTGDMYYCEWIQKRDEVRNNRTYKLIGAKNPLPQKVG